MNACLSYVQYTKLPKGFMSALVWVVSNKVHVFLCISRNDLSWFNCGTRSFLKKFLVGALAKKFPPRHWTFNVRPCSTTISNRTLPPNAD